MERWPILYSIRSCMTEFVLNVQCAAKFPSYRFCTQFGPRPFVHIMSYVAALDSARLLLIRVQLSIGLSHSFERSTRSARTHLRTATPTPRHPARPVSQNAQEPLTNDRRRDRRRARARTRWAASSASSPRPDSACSFEGFFQRTSDRLRTVHSTPATRGVRPRWTHLHHDLLRFMRRPTLHVVPPLAYMRSPLQQAALSLRHRHHAALSLRRHRRPQHRWPARTLNLLMTSPSATPSRMTPRLRPPLHRPPPRRRRLQTRTSSALI